MNDEHSDLKAYFSRLFNAHGAGDLSETYNAHWWKAHQATPATPAAEIEPESTCPSYRVVAEPCAQGFRLKRYEQVAGTAEMVLVSVEIVKQ